jgi:hypothetical protein
MKSITKIIKFHIKPILVSYEIIPPGYFSALMDGFKTKTPDFSRGIVVFLPGVLPVVKSALQP